MKKLFTCIAILAAMAMITVSCSKDEDKDSADNRLSFANQLTQNSTSAAWEGYDKCQRKELGNWVDERQSYVVIRFDRNSTSDYQGTGVVLTFENNYKEAFKEMSDFTWYFDDDQLKITYRRSGWQPVYAEYRSNELVINGSSFSGFWFEKTDLRYKFNYTKSTFNDWNNYKND
jgi:hypothetical protein